ncbi:MAG TPA: hypothetical protein VEB86_01500 [Chryseosolibacter sp.]|nr:hypothetical protein [Chryseosolibacter sp.]
MRIIATGIVLALLIGCGSGNSAKTDDIIGEIDTTTSTEPSISKELISNVLQSIPSPIEISVLLKQSGKKYNPSYLNASDNISKYNTNFKKALNLGIYGTDLGYTNIYEQNNDGVKYMASIKDLADGLNIGQFFDIETIGRLATNSKNLDSLLLITTQNFNNINHYLQTQSRENLSVLLLTGGWLEALHIVCEVSKANPDNKQLQETIGEQKIILENIMLLLSFYKDKDQNMASLLGDMNKLKDAFDKVTITYVHKPATFEVVGGVMVIKDNSTSTITITPDDIKSIGSITENIRTKVIS